MLEAAAAAALGGTSATVIRAIGQHKDPSDTTGGHGARNASAGGQSHLSPCPSACFATCGKRQCRFSLSPETKRRRTGGENEEVQGSETGDLLVRRTLNATHLLRAGADLDGVGDQPSRFLPGDCDDIFKSQRNLSKQRVQAVRTLTLIKTT